MARIVYHRVNPYISTAERAFWEKQLKLCVRAGEFGVLPRWGWAGRQWTSEPIFAVYKGYPIFIETEQTKSFCLPQAFLPRPPLQPSPSSSLHTTFPRPEQCPLTKPKSSFSEISGLGRLGEGVTWKPGQWKPQGQPLPACWVGESLPGRKELGQAPHGKLALGCGMWHLLPVSSSLCLSSLSAILGQWKVFILFTSETTKITCS